jgi:N-acetylmuramoyl-L-alanine amidase
MKIMLDAGHGIHTPGKRSPDGMREFYFNVAVANYMSQELSKYENVEVLFAHDPTGKRDVPLSERTNKANRENVDVYYSIHANANTGVMGNWTGIETYVYPSRPAGSVKLANIAQKRLVEATGLRNRGVKTANFHVLRETNMDAVLVEHGYMDSKIDLPKLKSDSFRRLCAKEGVLSLADAYGLKRKPKPKTAVKADGIFYRVVTGSFRDKDGAEARVAKLEKAGFKSFLDAETVKGVLYYRVITGSFESKINALDRAEELEKKGFDSFLAVYKK